MAYFTAGEMTEPDPRDWKNQKLQYIKAFKYQYTLKNQVKSTSDYKQTLESPINNGS